MNITTKFVTSSVIVLALIVTLIGGSTFFIRQVEASVEESRLTTRQALEITLQLQVSLRDQILQLQSTLITWHTCPTVQFDLLHGLHPKESDPAQASFRREIASHLLRRAS